MTEPPTLSARTRAPRFIAHARRRCGTIGGGSEAELGGDVRRARHRGRPSRAMTLTDPAPLPPILTRDGFAFVHADAFRRLLLQHGPLTDWDAFAASFDRLDEDTYLAERGRYRRRRHAIYSLGASGESRREPDGPHYQSLEHNPLYGGIERWFSPIEPAIGDGASIRTVLSACASIFGSLARDASRYRVEAHQFRIEARADLPGEPTPEGRHRDGVDYVLVLLVRRENIRRGTTSIHDRSRHLLGTFTLTHPFDAALVDDARVLHGVTPVAPKDPSLPAHRDVLVVTLRREG